MDSLPTYETGDILKEKGNNNLFMVVTVREDDTIIVEAMYKDKRLETNKNILRQHTDKLTA